jgi:hypothetical protein
MFPQLIAGPIVRYPDIEHDMDNRHISVDDFAAGIRRFSVGLGKKAILANALAGTADSIWAVSDAGSASVAWIGLISYTLQRHGDRVGDDAWVSLSGEFPVSLYFPQHYGILEAMAYFAVHVVPRLCIYSAGWQSEAPVSQLDHRVFSYGPVAWSGNQICVVGFVARLVYAD